MKVERPQPFVWPSWLSKLVAGENHCFWASWFKAHFKDYGKVPSDFNTAAWLIKHTALLRARADNLLKLGYRVLIEDQNSFKLNYKGAVVSGKPDIVAFGQEENLPGDMVEDNRIEDAKSGKPKISDQIQIMIYQIILPMAVPEYAATKFNGEVVYKLGVQNTEIPATVADDPSTRDAIFETIDKIIGPELMCHKVPSHNECKFCDITKADCPERCVK